MFANGCSDRTEEIVQQFSERDPRIQLVSLTSKGKVAALKHSIEFLSQCKNDDSTIDRVVYVDADIEFTHPGTLWHLSERLDSCEDLYLVSAFPQLSVASETGWLLRRIFAAREFLQKSVQYNVVRGPCYIIDFDVLQRVEYPDAIVIEDMYLEVRLDGHTIMDFERPVLHHQRSTLKGEIDRDLFTLLARNQIYSVKRAGLISALDRETARPEFKPTWFSTRDSLMRYLRHFKLGSLFFAGIWFSIHRFNQYRARRITRKANLSGEDILSLWSTQR